MPAPTPAPRAFYQARLDANRELRRRLDRTGLLLANLRLLFFLAALAFVGIAWAGRLVPVGWWLALACGALFLAAAVVHDRVLQRQRRTEQRIAIEERGLARLERRWAELPGRGDAYVDAEHPYSADLDLFGAASLFQLLDATTTRESERMLAGWLGAPAAGGPQEIEARQRAVAELRDRAEFREALEAEGRLLGPEKPDAARLIAWAEDPEARRYPRAVEVLRWALPAATAASWLLDRAGVLAAPVWLFVLAAQAALLLALRRTTASITRSVAGPVERFARYEKLFELLEREAFACDPLRERQARLAASGAAPSREMRRLARASGYLQLREQPLFHIPLNLLTLWDLHWCSSAAGWRRRCGGQVRRWFEGVAEIESLSSLAAFAFDNPDASFPRLESAGPRYEARGLGHPLLAPERRVANDVALGGEVRALLVTGSNMAGKTTLLRTVGINAVLALAGAPVCAAQLRLSPLQVRTSMRVRDSLAQGVSFFYAEVRRLKGVLDATAAGAPALFLLDEVLQGTNTAERQLASRSIVRQLIERGAIGAIATHDLGLTTLEQQTGGTVRNVHFTDLIAVGGEMSFDYRLRPGVVATTNALALLERAGIRVTIGDASRGR